MEPKPRWYTHEHVILAGILVFGFGLRAGYLAEIAQQPTFTHAVYDPQYNDYWARGLVTGDWTLPADVNDPEIRTTPHGRPPGYPYFLACVYFLFGTSYLAPRLVQMGLGLINIVLMFLLGRRLFGRTAGLVAAVFMAAYWVFIYFEGLLTYPAVVVFLLLVLMHVLCRWAGKPSIGWALASGVLLGAFGLFRPNGLLYGAVVLLWMAWVLYRRGKMGRVAPSAIAVTAGVLIVLLPPTVRNYVVAKDFVFISSYGGLNLYVGNNAEATGVEPRIPELKELAGIENWCCFDYPAVVRGLARKLGKEELTFSEANAYFYRQALGFVREHPLLFVKNTAKKALLFWGPGEITNDTVMAYDKAYSPILRHLPGFPVVLALFLLGMFMWFLDGAREQGKTGTVPSERVPERDGTVPASPPGEDETTQQARLVVFAFIPTYFASVLPFFIAGRYRVPIIPFLLLFGAYGVVRLGQLAVQRDYRRGAPSGLALLALLALAHWNPTGYAPSLSTWHFRYALACAESGERENAIAHYREAIAAGPRGGAAGKEDAAAYNNLGRLLAQQGKSDEAIAAYAAGLQLRPDEPILHINLGYELAKLGRFEEAVTHYETAIRLKPDLALAHVNLAVALEALEKWDEAARHYLQALELNPRDAFSASRHRAVRARLREGALPAPQREEADTLEHEGP